jgi:hypothetical protein
LVVLQLKEELVLRTGRFIIFSLIAQVLIGALAAYGQTTTVSLTTNDATSITSNSAVLNGSITTTGVFAAVWFEWGTSTSLGNRSDVQMLSSTSDALTFTQSLKNLQPHTTYYFRFVGYRAVAGAPNGNGDVKTFTTTGDTPTPPQSTITATTGDATSLTSTSAVLNGTVSSIAGPLAGWFEWGTTTSLGTRSDVQTTNDSKLTLTQTLKGLQPGTTYYFRAVGYGAGGSVPGDVHTFSTPQASPATMTVETGDATSVTSNSAVLNGAVSASAGPMAGWFEWGTTTALGTKSDVQTTSDAKLTLSQTVKNLQPGTTYYFRAVGYAAGGSVPGAVHTFSTPKATTLTVNIPDVEQGTIRSGYVVITPDASSGAPTPMLTFGTVSGGTVQSQAGIIPTQLATDASMFVDIVPSLSRDIGVAFVNPNDTVNVVTLTLRDENGDVAGTPATVSVPAHGQVAKFVDELFGSVIAAGFRGSMRMQSTAAFAVIGFRFSGSVFSTLAVSITTPVPGVPTMTLAAGSTPNSPLAGTIGGLTAILIPQFALSGGWSTQLVLVNNTGATITGRIDVFDATGKPMPVKLNGQTQSTFTYSIPAGGTFVLAPRDSNGQSPL